MYTLKIQSMTVNGHPNLCPECGSEAYTLDGTGFIDAFPVRGNCWQSHSWEEPLITLGDLKQIAASSTGRERAEDIDTFRIVIGGALLEGVLHPGIVLDDLKRVVNDVYWKRLIKPMMRRKKRAAIRGAKRAAGKAGRAAAKPVSNTVAAAKAAAIGAAWGLQAGGHEADPDYAPDPVNACPFCDGGHIAIESNLHNITSVRCSVCSGTGEID